MVFKVGDKVRICHNPVSLLKSHADKRAEIIQKGFGSEWLLSIEGSKWWVKEFDFEKEEEEEPLPFSTIEKVVEFPQFQQRLRDYDRRRL